MKKMFISFITAIILIMSNICCYATGSSSSPISQIELTDYVIIAGGIIFLIGMGLIFLSLFLSSSKNKNIYDEEYDLEEDDINIIDEADEYTSEDYQEEQAEDISSEETAEEIVEEPEAIDELAEETVEEQIEEAAEEPIEEITEEAVPDVEESIVEEPIEETPEEVVEEPIKSVRLMLSGTNNSDLKMVDITDTAYAGRRSSNDLLISDSAVSGQHCKFTYDGENLYVEDLNSTNGTFLNDKQIEKSEIKSGDTLLLGQKQYKITIS